MINFIIGILEQGLIFAIVSLGVYITYKILDFPDLSVDGTFPLGAAVTALCLSMDMNPFLACILSMIAGMAAGIITGLLHVKLKITNLLSGILVMIGLYSINLRIMGKSNVPFFGFNTIFTVTRFIKPIILIVICSIMVKVLLDIFLKTKIGFLLKAVGDNEQLVTSLGINKDMIKVMGLSISNGLVALAGSIMAQHQGYADAGMGTGTVVTGLAAVILGSSLLKSLKFVKATTMSLLGAIVYKLAVGAALRFGLETTDLKLMTALIVIVVLGANNFKIAIGLRKDGKERAVVASNKKSIQSIQ
ncbi:Autoinducer 2 import system permease protein LsrC [Clostridium thermopalmarium DSM 5974]|uniref:Autoinducer 2 import system permease protein LsrC n=2 Tax=Clostridium TaxID=1485 RepID=A0A151AN06_9CLOT|nr:autoinducer 2 import system permease protein LsrC [Clostridium colicanis DSM 13634]PRR73681.1 Autoinducer 2 import system permease protein LsrC [Clostridium thermopalmarium DSM 5974]PVZ21067.1 putative ABC transport system permease protein [Clostridium thermopalmarium DSM 5974]